MTIDFATLPHSNATRYRVRQSYFAWTNCDSWAGHKTHNYQMISSCKSSLFALAHTQNGHLISKNICGQKPKRGKYAHIGSEWRFDKQTKRHIESSDIRISYSGRDAAKKRIYEHQQKQKNKSVDTTNGQRLISSDSSLGSILNKRVIVSYQMLFHANECRRELSKPKQIDIHMLWINVTEHKQHSRMFFFSWCGEWEMERDWEREKRIESPLISSVLKFALKATKRNVEFRLRMWLFPLLMVHCKNEYMLSILLRFMWCKQSVIFVVFSLFISNGNTNSKKNHITSLPTAIFAHFTLSDTFWSNCISDKTLWLWEGKKSRQSIKK